MDIFDMLENLREFGILILGLLNGSSDFVKVFVMFMVMSLYGRYGKKPTVFLISWFGKKLLSNRYLLSFFDNRKLMGFGSYLFPLLLINWFAHEYHWLFDPLKYMLETGRLSSPTDMSWFFTRGKVVDSVLYLVNFSYFIYWLHLFLTHSVNYLKNDEKHATKPLHSFAQIIFFIILLIGLIVAFSHYTNQSTKTLLTTLSVMSMAVFLTLKDVVMGIVSTVMIIVTDIVQVGDWIKSDKYNADGRITEINLVTVKVLNYDKTITTIPTYSLISEGFQNQQEILKSKRRRIKELVRIDSQSVHFLTLEEVEKYKEIKILSEYIEKRVSDFKKQQSQEMQEIKAENQKISEINILNEKHFTNLGLFRKYVERMLKEHPMIYSPTGKMKENEMEVAPTVSIKEGTREGIALEFSFFSNNAEWRECEHLTSTIKEQIYASAKYFDLNINA